MINKVHLLYPKDESGILILSMPSIDKYVEFDTGGNAALSSKTDEELLSCTQVVFDSEIESRIENAISLTPISTEAERVFKAELIIMKAIILDKNSTNEI